MTKQAQNSLKLFKGQRVSSIKMALGFQKESVVNELKEYFNVSNLDTLAMRLSIG